MGFEHTVILLGVLVFGSIGLLSAVAISVYEVLSGRRKDVDWLWFVVVMPIVGIAAGVLTPVAAVLLIPVVVRTQIVNLLTTPRDR